MKHEIADEGDARRYWTQVPNIVFDIGLNYQELVLYLHLKRTAGASGKCFKSVRTLSKDCGMSPTIIVRAKTSLQKRRKELNNKPLIAVVERENPNGGKPFHEVTLTDIWRQNTERYAPAEQVPNMELDPSEQVPRETVASSIYEPSQVPDMEHKKNYTEEELKEEKEPSPHARLMDFLQTRYGPIANGGKEGKAVKWLLEHGYDPAQCEGCFDYLAAQSWRTTPVTWVTVQSNIGPWLNGNGNGQRPAGKNVANIQAGLRYLDSLSER